MPKGSRGGGVLTPDLVPGEDRGSLSSSHIPGLIPGKPRSGPAHPGFAAPGSVQSLPAISSMMGGQDSRLPSDRPTSSLTPPVQAMCCSHSKPCKPKSSQAFPGSLPTSQDKVQHPLHCPLPPSRPSHRQVPRLPRPPHPLHSPSIWNVQRVLHPSSG